MVRHGEARSEYEDPKRPLSDRGRKEVEQVALAAAARKARVAEILHSGKLRARQTAEILARALSVQESVREIQGLSPDDDPLVAKAELEVSQEPLMLVGHLPHLGRLASILVVGEPAREVVEFPTAGIACLSREEGGWKIKWTLGPERK